MCCLRKVAVGLERCWLSKSDYIIGYCRSLYVIYKRELCIVFSIRSSKEILRAGRV